MELIETGLELETAPLPGVLALVWAEGEGDGAGLDLGDGADDVDDGADLDEGDEGDGADEGEGAEGDGEGEGNEKVDGRRGSKEFREALKAWEATPEGAKFAKQVKNDHFRVQELATIEPGGVTALREKYALIESVGGAEGITQMQQQIADVGETDQALIAGDPKALEALGPDFDPGLAKLAPHILDRVMKSDPDAYSAAILPHLMSALGGSPMVGDLNRMIDVLQAPHLDEKGKIDAVTKLLGRIGQWFELNEKKAGELKTAPVDKQRGALDQERTKLEQDKQDHHWKSNIIPTVAQSERTKFDELLRPYAAKLKLSPAQKEAALKDFRSKLGAACNADDNYTRQRDLYRKQKDPSPAAVINWTKSVLVQKAKTAFDAVRAERWGNVTAASGKQQQRGTRQVVPGARSQTGNGGGAPTIVSVKPPTDEIDYANTSEAEQWAGIYTLKTGKQVKVQKKRA